MLLRFTFLITLFKIEYCNKITLKMKIFLFHELKENNYEIL